jgi:hypothetical protein
MVSQLEETIFRELKSGDSLSARIDGTQACLKRAEG